MISLLKFSVLIKEKLICYEDFQTENRDQLECFFKPLIEIKIKEASAFFIYKLDQKSWVNNNFPRENCELSNLNEKKANLTYSTQVECNRTLTKILQADQGGFCRLTQEYLLNTIFKTQNYILQTTNNIHPFPFGFLIRYTCS